jgi:hypothetical protein
MILFSCTCSNITTSKLYKGKAFKINSILGMNEDSDGVFRNLDHN